jgi:hypothetical protein
MTNNQPTNINKKLEKILFSVEKPGRYVGGEHNQVRKDWNSVKTHIALVFPDIYDLGQPNLGLAILYDIVNQQPDMLAERAYSPWVDMEAQLRENKIPLFSLESKTPLNKFDIIGFTLPYEQIYTNVLNILDLSGVPLLASERTAEHPLIIAGGQACYNPEPMADFIDAFAIGEGEELILEISRAYQEWKRYPSPRLELFQALARIPGVYVPVFMKYRTRKMAQSTAFSHGCKVLPCRLKNASLPGSPPRPPAFSSRMLKPSTTGFPLKLCAGAPAAAAFAMPAWSTDLCANARRKNPHGGPGGSGRDRLRTGGLALAFFLRPQRAFWILSARSMPGLRIHACR